MRIYTLAALALAVPALAFAHGYHTDSLDIGHPWARPAQKGMTGGAYFTVTNKAKTPETLVSVSSPVAAKAEMHQSAMQGAVMTMRAVPTLVIQPGQTVRFEPGGYHVMLIGLKQPLVVGQRVPATLTFAKAGKIDVELVIQTDAPKPGAMTGMDHGAMGH